MRLILVAALLLAGTGCGQFQKSMAKITGYSKVCVEGVTYVQFASGVAVLVDRDGRPVPCK